MDRLTKLHNFFVGVLVVAVIRVAKSHEDDALQCRRTTLQHVFCSPERDAAGVSYWVAERTGRNGRKRNRFQLVLVRNPQTIAIAACEQTRVSRITGVNRTDGMSNEFRAKVIALRDRGVARLASA